MLQCVKVLAKITIVTKIDAVALEAFHGGRQRHASERHFEDFLHIANSKSVPRDLVAINVELDVVTAHHALGKHAGCARNLTDDSFDFSSDTLQFRKVGSGNIGATRVQESSQQLETALREGVAEGGTRARSLADALEADVMPLIAAIEAQLAPSAA